MVIGYMISDHYIALTTKMYVHLYVCDNNAGQSS